MSASLTISALLPAHVAARVTVSPSGCWIWRGATDRYGYGFASIGGRMFRLHRWAYCQAHGEIPRWLDLDHLCRTPGCCNPAHLEPVTHRENLLRSPVTRASINRAKTHCRKGHPFDERNTYWWNPRGGRLRRYCIACRHEQEMKMASNRTRRAA